MNNYEMCKLAEKLTEKAIKTAEGRVRENWEFHYCNCTETGINVCFKDKEEKINTEERINILVSWAFLEERIKEESNRYDSQWKNELFSLIGMKTVIKKFDIKVASYSEFISFLNSEAYCYFGDNLQEYKNIWISSEFEWANKHNGNFTVKFKYYIQTNKVFCEVIQEPDNKLAV